MYYREHLQVLRDCLRADAGAVLAYSGVRHDYNRYADGQIPGQVLQLVQCMHLNTVLRWTARDELESDDLERLYWNRLRELGHFAASAGVTCEWVSHPAQRHKLPEMALRVLSEPSRRRQPASR